MSQLLARSAPTRVPALVQGMMVAEVIMDHLARACGKSAAEIRSLNIYKEGETTHFGQVLDGCQVTHAHHTVLCCWSCFAPGVQRTAMG